MATDQNLCNGAPVLFIQFCTLIDSAGFESIKTLLTSLSYRITVFAPIDGAFTTPLPTLLEEQKGL
jgi:hypothetical protein